MSAPHLPPKIDDLIPGSALQSLPWVLFLVGVSVLTSVAVTLATIVWLAPSVIPSDLAIRIGGRNERREGTAPLNPAVINDVRRRLWLIHDRRQKLNGGFYPAASAPYQALMFSSDGWLVAAVPGYRAGAERGWEVINYQGETRAIERAVPDSLSGLIYLKVAGEGFPFAAFANWEAIGADTAVWYSDQTETWRAVKLGQPTAIPSERRHRLTEPQWQYRLPAGAVPGQILIDDAGVLVGFVGAEQQLIEGWRVENQYVSILAQGKIRYLSVPWLGQAAEGFVAEADGVGGRRVSGFYVTVSPTGATSSTVGAGDLVTHIQNQPVDVISLPRRVLSAPERFVLTVWRNGGEIDMIVEKMEI